MCSSTGGGHLWNSPLEQCLITYSMPYSRFFAHCKQSLGRPRNEMHYIVWIFICGVNVDINPEEGQQHHECPPSSNTNCHSKIINLFEHC